MYNDYDDCHDDGYGGGAPPGVGGYDSCGPQGYGADPCGMPGTGISDAPCDAPCEPSCHSESVCSGPGNPFPPQQNYEPAYIPPPQPSYQQPAYIPPAPAPVARPAPAKAIHCPNVCGQKYSSTRKSSMFASKTKRLYDTPASRRPATGQATAGTFTTLGQDYGGIGRVKPSTNKAAATSAFKSKTPRLFSDKALARQQNQEGPGPGGLFLRDTADPRSFSYRIQQLANR
eukprot:NODE_2880_length_1021_cov_134.293210_g2412_i0.p3 GENE.NODE_2880_length_1021_cov_134.293210_g2412_i0~~NODE_2880_length_1021_cov_134.293210_g2412_i0.p3  ORF type:complete len:230 (-),score=36.51 NODE_2880_length_1021_cov_134.293210_g2412_i0:79-768(-)